MIGAVGRFFTRKVHVRSVKSAAVWPNALTTPAMPRGTSASVMRLTVAPTPTIATALARTMGNSPPSAPGGKSHGQSRGRSGFGGGSIVSTAPKVVRLPPAGAATRRGRSTVSGTPRAPDGIRSTRTDERSSPADGTTVVSPVSGSSRSSPVTWPRSSSSTLYWPSRPSARTAAAPRSGRTVPSITRPAGCQRLLRGIELHPVKNELDPVRGARGVLNLRQDRGAAVDEPRGRQDHREQPVPGEHAEIHRAIHPEPIPAGAILDRDERRPGVDRRQPVDQEIGLDIDRRGDGDGGVRGHEHRLAVGRQHDLERHARPVAAWRARAVALPRRVAGPHLVAVKREPHRVDEAGEVRGLHREQARGRASVGRWLDERQKP